MSALKKPSRTVRHIGSTCLANFGYSRDKRPDRPQVSMGLLTSREGILLAHLLFPGRQSDARAMAEASNDFRARLNLGSFVVAADRGTVSGANLQALRDEDIRYVIAGRLRRSKGSEALGPGRQVQERHAPAGSQGDSREGNEPTSSA